MKAHFIVVNSPNDGMPVRHIKENPKTRKRHGFKPPNSLFFECKRKTPIIYDFWIFENGRTIARKQTKDQKEVLHYLKEYHEIGRKGFVSYAQHKLDFYCTSDMRIKTLQNIWRHTEVGIFSLKSMKWCKPKLKREISIQHLIESMD